MSEQNSSSGPHAHTNVLTQAHMHDVCTLDLFSIVSAFQKIGYFLNNDAKIPAGLVKKKGPGQNPSRLICKNIMKVIGETFSKGVLYA